MKWEVGKVSERVTKRKDADGIEPFPLCEAFCHNVLCTIWYYLCVFHILQIWGSFLCLFVFLWYCKLRMVIVVLLCLRSSYLWFLLLMYGYSNKWKDQIFLVYKIIGVCNFSISKVDKNVSIGLWFTFVFCHWWDIFRPWHSNTSNPRYCFKMGLVSLSRPGQVWHCGTYEGLILQCKETSVVRPLPISEQLWQP